MLIIYLLAFNNPALIISDYLWLSLIISDYLWSDYLWLYLWYSESQTSISLRGKLRLVIPSVNTTNYGLHSFRYHASKLWNLLPDNVRVSASLAPFKIAQKTVQLDDECCSFCDQCYILKLPVHTCIFLSIILNFYPI